MFLISSPRSMFALDTASLKFSCYIVTVFSQRVQLQLVISIISPTCQPVRRGCGWGSWFMVNMQTTLQISLTLHGRESSTLFLGTSNMKMPYLCSFNLIMHGLSSKIGIQIKLEWKLNLVDFSWCSRNMYFRCPTSTLKFVQFFILNKTVQNTLLVCPKNAF